MSAMIDMSGGRANIAYKGQVPWFGLGQDMPDGASLDQWRVEAGLGWEAKMTPILFKDGEDILEADSKIIYRSDTKAQLGLATNRYKPVQPVQVVEFFRELCDAQGFSMETLGSLDGGKRIWALANTGDDFKLNKEDEVGAFVLLATSFDGSLATRAQFTTVRVVCQNTLSMAIQGSGKNAISIKHSADFDSKSVKTDLGIYKDSFKTMEEQAGVLSEKGISEKKAQQFIIEVLNGEGAKEEDLSSRAANVATNVYKLFDGDGMGAEMKTSKGTLWGLVNAVTQHVDHHMGYKDDARLRSAWFGKGDDIKTTAFKKAVDMAA